MQKWPSVVETAIGQDEKSIIYTMPEQITSSISRLRITEMVEHDVNMRLKGQGINFTVCHSEVTCP